MQFRLRTLLIVQASFLIGLAVALGVDRVSQAGMWEETRLLRAPGEMITWLFILGDVGTDDQYRFWEIATGSAFYGCIAFTVAKLASCAFALRQRTHSNT